MSLKRHPTKGPDWWYIIISHGRKAPAEYITFQGTEVEAKAFENEIRGIAPDNENRLKVIDKLSSFLEWHKTNMSAKTHVDCQAAFKKLLPYLGNKYIAYLHNRDYEPYKAARLSTSIIPKKRGHRPDRKHDSRAETEEEYEIRCQAETRYISKRTIQIELNHFRSFLRWCKEEEKITVGDFPKGFPKSQQKPKQKVVLAPSEIPTLLGELSEGFQRTLTMLMLQNGLRKTEALTLRKSNVDLVNNCLIVTGKNDKTRVVPIVTEELRKALEGQGEGKKPVDFLFINPRTERPYTNIKKSLKSAAVAAGIDKRVYNHLMRHSFVTSAIMSGVPVAAVRDMAGHEDIRTTQGYTHLIMDYLKTESSKIASVMSATETGKKQNDNI